MNNKNEKNNLKNDLPIRQVMADMKDDLYAIVNPELNALEDFAKSLYLRVLGTVIQYGNEPSDLQSLYFKRIVKGMTKDESPYDIMKRALEISAKDIREFVDYLKEKPARFYFALDAAVLTALGGGSQAGCEYLAELLEVLGISKQELQCISLIAKSIVTQQPSIYDEAKPLMTEELCKADFAPYLKNFYAGALVDTPNHHQVFIAPAKNLSGHIKYPGEYKARRVSFSNLAIDISDKVWTFLYCEDIVFENCDISGSNYSLMFTSCERITFINCHLFDFRTYAINMSDVKQMCLTNCEFTNCICYYNRRYDDWKELGGVIHELDTNHKVEVIISKCLFKDCGGHNEDCYNSDAIISNAMCNVTNSKFINCWNTHTRGYSRERDEFSKYHRKLFCRCEQKDNEVIDSAELC